MEKVGNYIFNRDPENIIGEGSFSQVYKGKYILNSNFKDDRIFSTKRNANPLADCEKNKKEVIVAIKIINMNRLKEREKKAIYEEIKMMEIIIKNPHENIIKCYDVINNKDEVFIIMEYCDSGDLKNIMKKPLKEKYAQYYFGQIANGLKYLYNYNVTHRDIKPKNILLTNNKRIIKIADFGFAKNVKENNLMETICGSPLYMAPELIGNKLYNNQTDLWSMGMVLFEMLFGYHPYGYCRDIPELRKNIEENDIEIPPPDTINKNLSNDCIDLLLSLLEKKPDKRIKWEHFFMHNWITKYNIKNANTIKNTSKNTILDSDLRHEKNNNNDGNESMENINVINNKRSNVYVPNSIIKSGDLDIYETKSFRNFELRDEFIESINLKDTQNDYIFEMEMETYEPIIKKESEICFQINNLIDRSSIINGYYTIIN